MPSYEPLSASDRAFYEQQDREKLEKHLPHSPAPWRVTRQNGTCVYVGTTDGRTIAMFGGYGTAKSQKDARRVIDLVNALSGIDIQDVRKWARIQRITKARKLRKAVEAKG
jgi:hypothetical protein